MRTPRIVDIALCFTAALGVGDLEQRRTPIAEARIRALAREAEAEGRGDRNEIVLALDKRFRARWGSFESFPVSIVRREDLTIFLTTPYMAYRRAVAEFLRMREPLRKVPWVDAAVVTVSPDRNSSPDIVQIVVRRGDREIPPITNLLKAMTFTNGFGQSAVLHAGEVHFPMSAFAPGQPVTVMAVAQSGERFTLSLEDAQLLELK
jgi:hypothetical protein